MLESHIRPQHAGAPAHDEPPAVHRNALLDGGVAVAVAAARPGSRAARGALVAGPAQNASTFGLDLGLDDQPRAQPGDLLDDLPSDHARRRQGVDLATDPVGG
jgi:hypothetical protein